MAVANSFTITLLLPFVFQLVYYAMLNLASITAGQYGSPLRWPTTVTSNTNYSHQIQNPDIKYKLLTSNTNCSHQIQITHIKSNYSHQIQNPDIKYKLFTSNTNCSHQIQITHIKYKLLTSKTNYSHQIQNPEIKYKLLISNTKF